RASSSVSSAPESDWQAHRCVGRPAGLSDFCWLLVRLRDAARARQTVDKRSVHRRPVSVLGNRKTRGTRATDAGSLGLPPQVLDACSRTASWPFTGRSAPVRI